MTPEAIERLLRAEMKLARRERRRLSFRDDIMVHTCTLLEGEREHARLPMPFRSNEEKRAMFWKVACFAKIIGITAIIVATDTRMLESGPFIKHFGLRPIDPAQSGEMERFKREYTTIRDQQFGGEMANLPPHLWTSAIVCALKTVDGDTRVLRVAYIDDGHDRPLYDPVDGEQLTAPENPVELSLLPDWWKISDDDPAFAVVRTAAEALLPEALRGR